ncbi:glycoside hydrolase family 172 protein [Candidatus Latescibacterota bacterium]
MTIHGSGPLANLAVLRDVKRRRISSHDITHGNRDYRIMKSGDRLTIADINGPGCIRHIWMTLGAKEAGWPRKVVLRVWWDSQEQPSIEAPIGDFFGIGGGIVKNFQSLPLNMGPENGRGFNCYFPMPFAQGARIELESNCDEDYYQYYYIDYEEFSQPNRDLGYFHAQWRRENPTEGWGDPMMPKQELVEKQWDVPSDWRQNYVILDAQGKGHYVGCNLCVDQFEKQKNAWYGEGDDHILIDGDKGAALWGTGTEDYFNTAWCPTQEYDGPYSGITQFSGYGWSNKNCLYRFHIEDPVFFEQSLQVSIEHGHANHLWNDYSSTAYWYQTLPTGSFPELPDVEGRLPRKDETLKWYARD